MRWIGMLRVRSLKWPPTHACRLLDYVSFRVYSTPLHTTYTQLPSLIAGRSSTFHNASSYGYLPNVSYRPRFR